MLELPWFVFKFKVGAVDGRIILIDEHIDGLAKVPVEEFAQETQAVFQIFLAELVFEIMVQLLLLLVFQYTCFSLDILLQTLMDFPNF